MNVCYNISMKILGDNIFAKDASGNPLSRIATIFLRTPGLVTRKGVHAMQRAMWIEEINAGRAADGKPPMTQEEEDAEIFREIDRWFVENLPEPPMCKTGDQRVITFFKTESTEEMIRHIEPAMALLDKYNHPYDVVYTNFVGNIVYEDEFQVAVQLE